MKRFSKSRRLAGTARRSREARVTESYSVNVFCIITTHSRARAYTRVVAYNNENDNSITFSNSEASMTKADNIRQHTENFLFFAQEESFSGGRDVLQQ